METKDTQQMEGQTKEQPETIKPKARSRPTNKEQKEQSKPKAKATDEVKTLKMLGVNLQTYKTAELFHSQGKTSYFVMVVCHCFIVICT